MRLVTLRGREMPLEEALVGTGITPKTYYSRIFRGWTEEEALTSPRGARLVGAGNVRKAKAPHRHRGQKPPAYAPWAPDLIVRRLISYGLVCAGKLERYGEWLTDEMLDRDTREPRGRRWIRFNKGSQRYELRKERP